MGFNREEAFSTDILYLENLYSNSDGFQQYVDRYCEKHNVVKEVALTHSTVINAAQYYVDD